MQSTLSSSPECAWATGLREGLLCFAVCCLQARVATRQSNVAAALTSATTFNEEAKALMELDKEVTTNVFAHKFLTHEFSAVRNALVHQRQRAGHEKPIREGRRGPPTGNGCKGRGHHLPCHRGCPLAERCLAEAEGLPGEREPDQLAVDGFRE